MRADQLARGDRVLGTDGRMMRVKGIEAGSGRVGTAYNLEVAGIHTYQVGERGVLVHNSCGSSVPRNADGTFAPRNGEPGRAGAADEATAMDQLAMDGAKVQRGQQSVQVDGFPRRNYDGAAQVDGKWLGVETKGATSPKTAQQRTFDDWLNTPGNTATTTNGTVLEGVLDVWVP